MKLFFVLLLPFMLALSGAASAPAQDALLRTQADAVAAIKRSGGNVGTDERSGGVIVYLYWNSMDAVLEHLKDVTGVTSVNFDMCQGSQITDARLEHLKGMTSLTELKLSNTQITDSGLVHLKGLTSLRKLLLNDTRVTDTGLSDLKAALPNCEISVQ